MRILEVHILAFGGVKDLTLSFEAGVNCLHRPNGWGKTTLAAFIKAMLYGLPDRRGTKTEERERKRYQPRAGGVFGGSIRFESAKGRFLAERFFGERESADRFTLYDLSTNLESNAYSRRLGEELFGIDADGFARTVLLSQRERITGESESLCARLAALVEAAEDAGDFESAEAAIEKRMRYYRTTGNRGRIAQLRADLIAAQRACEEAHGAKAELADVGRALLQAEEEIRASSAAKGEEARDALLTHRASLAERFERLRTRVETLDRAANGTHPSREELARAREAVRACERLQARHGEAPQKRGSLAPWICLLVPAAVLLSVGIPLSLPALWIAGGVMLPTALVPMLLTLRARGRAAREREAREEALEDARQARDALLMRVGAIGAQERELAQIEEREIEYRITLADAKRAQKELARFDETHGTLLPDESQEARRAHVARLHDRAASLRARLARLQALAEELPAKEGACATLAKELARAEHAYETLFLTLEHLRAAKESLSVRYVDRMEERMGEYLSRLSADPPFPIVDASLSLFAETDALRLPLSLLSSGWRELFDFCARLSLCDVLFEETETPPLILDDPFVNLDEAHLSAATRLLSSLSSRYQILYAVCHAERGLS